MKKAKKIIYDLKHTLKGKKRVFNYYDVEHNVRESKNLDISVLDIIRALEPYEVDFKRLYKVDFEDVYYDDAEGNYSSIDLDYKYKANNSYNWSSQVVFNYGQIKVIDKHGNDRTFITIKFHRYGDVRGNYTQHMILDIDFDLFYEILFDATNVYSSVIVNNKSYTISTDCMKEACVFDVNSDDGEEYFYDVVLDIDNLRNKKDIKKGLKKFLQENND